MTVSPSRRPKRGRRGALTVEQIIALIYLRVSSHEQEETGLSLPNQLRDAQRYCARHADWIAGEEFQDVMSGRRDDRPGYLALKAAVQLHALAGKKVVVVVQRLDRIGRNMLERVQVWKELEELGAEIHSDAEGQTPRFVYNVYAAAAEEEVRQLSDRVKRTWAGLEEKGWHHPGRASWGYDWRPRTAEEQQQGAPEKVLVPHEEHAAYAIELWERYAGGESAEVLLRWARGLPDVAKGDRRFSSTAFREMLRSPVYIGRLGREHDIGACAAEEDRCPILDEPTGRWKALVSDETWQLAHAQYRKARRMPMQASGGYLLSGLIRCPECGGRMVGNTNERGYARYLCNSRCTGTEEQRASPCYCVVPTRAVDEAVVDTVIEMLERVMDRSYERKLREAYRREVAHASRDDTAKRVADLERELVDAHKLLSAVSQRYLTTDEIPEIAYKATVADLSQQIGLMQAEVERLRSLDRRPKPMPPDVLLAVIGAWAPVFRDADPSVQRSALGDLVEWVRPVRVGRGRYEVALRLTTVGMTALKYAVTVEPTPNLVAVHRFGTTNRLTSTNPAPTLAASA